MKERAIADAIAGAGGQPVILETQVALDASAIADLEGRLAAIAGRSLELHTRVNPRLDSAARLVIGDRTRIDLDPRSRLVSAAEAHPTPEETRAHLAEIIARTELSFGVDDIGETGEVLDVGDGVVTVSGLWSAGAQELVRFANGTYGIAFNLLDDTAGCLLLGPEEEIDEGSRVERTGRLLQVPAGDALIGRVINALGLPIDGLGPIPTDRLAPAEKIAPGVLQRHPVVEPLHSGIKIIDALVPLGRGQRELIVGDRKIGKTTIALDTILNQKGTGVICIYAAIGQKASTVARVVAMLREHGALAYTIVVAAFPNEQPAFRHFAPFTACAIGESIMERGGHALVVYDDLTKHAVTYREISALLERPIGREAYPGDVFYLHSRLLERAARLRDDLGGGSLTALPIVETLSGDISAFIPTNVISICDGQIVLDARLFNQGLRPGMDVGLSVSRVGSMAQTKAMKKVAGRLRIDLASYMEMSQFVRFGAEVDQATLAQLTRGEREREVLKQDPGLPLPVEKQIAVLYAAVHGYFDAVPIPKLRACEAELLAHLEQSAPEVLAGIRELGDLTAEGERLLAQAIAAFTGRG